MLCMHAIEVRHFIRYLLQHLLDVCKLYRAKVVFFHANEMALSKKEKMLAVCFHLGAQPVRSKSNNKRISSRVIWIFHDCFSLDVKVKFPVAQCHFGLLPVILCSYWHWRLLQFWPPLSVSHRLSSQSFPFLLARSLRCFVEAYANSDVIRLSQKQRCNFRKYMFLALRNRWSI